MEDSLNPLPYNVTLSGHGGGLYWVNSWMFYMPSENIGVIYFNNGDKNYEQNIALPVISSLIMSLLLYQKGGLNLFSHIESRNIGS